jgi:hypothetical protein
MMHENKKEIVIEKLKALSSTDRMKLLNQYTRQTENVYCAFSAQKNMEIIIKVFILKFDNNALVEAYQNGDLIVDRPGCTLKEFLDNEMMK